MTSLYISNLYVMLLKGKPSTRIESFKDLTDSPSAKIFLVSGTSIINTMMFSTNPVYRRIWERVTSGMGGFVDYDSMYDVVSEDNYLISTLSESSDALYGGQNIYIGKHLGDHIDAGLVMRKSLPKYFKNLINTEIRHIIESGLVERIRDKHVYRMKQKSNYSDSLEYQRETILLSIMGDLFIRFMVLVGVSCLVALCEMFWKKCIKCRKQ